MHRADLALGLLFGAAFCYVLYDIQGMRWQAALAPGMAGVAGLVLVIMHLVTTKRRSQRETDRSGHRYIMGDALAIAGFLCSVGLVLLLGFAIGGTLFVLGAVMIATRGNFVLSVLLAAPVYPFHAIAVERGLGIVMFDGFLWGWFG